MAKTEQQQGPKMNLVNESGATKVIQEALKQEYYRGMREGLAKVMRQIREEMGNGSDPTPRPESRPDPHPRARAAIVQRRMNRVRSHGIITAKEAILAFITENAGSEGLRRKEIQSAVKKEYGYSPSTIDFEMNKLKSTGKLEVREHRYFPSAQPYFLPEEEESERLAS